MKKSAGIRHLTQTRDSIAKQDGLLLCPEGAATAVAYKKALAQGLVSREETAVLYNCATGLKYPMAEVNNDLDKNVEVDYSMFL